MQRTLIPSPGRFHMPQSKLSPCATATEPCMPQSPCSTARGATKMRSPCTATRETLHAAAKTQHGQNNNNNKFFKKNKHPMDLVVEGGNWGFLPSSGSKSESMPWTLNLGLNLTPMLASPKGPTWPQEPS